MRGRSEVRLLENPLDRGVRALAGRPAGAIGHRQEARTQGLQCFDRLPERVSHLLGLGWEEFEADLDISPRPGEERYTVRMRLNLSGTGHYAAFFSASPA